MQVQTDMLKAKSGQRHLSLTNVILLLTVLHVTYKQHTTILACTRYLQYLQAKQLLLAQELTRKGTTQRNFGTSFREMSLVV